MFKRPEFWIKFLAYAIPACFLGYILYWNFLPFGYDKTFTIQVGSASDTSGEFYLEPSRYLSERKTAPDGTTYRELNGSATAVFKPKAVLKNATITVSVEGDGIGLIPPKIDFNPALTNWNNSWDFTTGIPKDLKGNAFFFDGCAYFDGKIRLELPNSSNRFETGPFSVYAEWRPDDSEHDFQEIVGHYNWELVQNKDSVMFQVGRMNNKFGPVYKIQHSITPDFFNKYHTALAVYTPAENGHIDLFIDGSYAGQVYIGQETIWRQYNEERNLTFGKSDHGTAINFSGCLNSVAYVERNIIPIVNSASFTSNADTSYIYIYGEQNNILKKILLYVRN